MHQQVTISSLKQLNVVQLLAQQSFFKFSLLVSIAALSMTLLHANFLPPYEFCFFWYLPNQNPTTDQQEISPIMLMAVKSTSESLGFLIMRNFVQKSNFNTADLFFVKFRTRKKIFQLYPMELETYTIIKVWKPFYEVTSFLKLKTYTLGWCNNISSLQLNNFVTYINHQPHFQMIS
jgi:hypothetical protein